MREGKYSGPINKIGAQKTPRPAQSDSYFLSFSTSLMVMRVKTTGLMETPGPQGTNHSHVTSSGASMKITPLQWPVILISALGKSGTGSTGRARYEQTKRNARHSRERRREREKEKQSKIVSHLWWVIAYWAVMMFAFPFVSFCTMFWVQITGRN